MAGGENAAACVCPVCLLRQGQLVKAVRFQKGVETDMYRCDKGHQSGISWDGEPLPVEPLWPPSDRDRQRAELVSHLLSSQKTELEIMQALAKADLLD